MREKEAIRITRSKVVGHHEYGPLLAQAELPFSYSPVLSPAASMIAST